MLAIEIKKDIIMNGAIVCTDGNFNKKKSISMFSALKQFLIALYFYVVVLYIFQSLVPFLETCKETDLSKLCNNFSTELHFLEIKQIVST